MTVLVQLDCDRPQEEAIKQAAKIIQSGRLVAFPTETVYGLGADAMNEIAVRRIFEAKGRPADNPLIVHVADRAMVDVVARSISSVAERVIERFWPGPLTLVFKRRPEVARSVSAGLPTVAVRMPHNRIALELIGRADTPLAAPSANRSGRPSPTSAAHVLQDLGGRIDMILDGGTTNIGIESTVLDMTTSLPVILRPGWITPDMIAGVTGPVSRAVSETDLRRSPGTRHRHYSPRARVLLVEQASPERIERLCAELLEGGPAGFIGHTAVALDHPEFTKIILERSAASYAHSIYAALRELDGSHPRVILIEGIEERGEGAAVMDRLRRAASEVLRESE